MINVDQNLAVSDARADFAQPFKTCRVGRNNAIEFVSGLRFLKSVVRVQELVFLRIAILIPTERLLALISERQRQS